MATTTEVNPSSLTNPGDAGAGANGTPSSGKPPPIITNGASAKASAKPTQSMPRVDVEPIYTALKASIGDHWATYKDAVSRFVLGFLNQDELCRATQHFIAVDPAIEHLHNQLLCAILANVVRDAPDAGVASWVSANDKPTNVSKPVTGNAAEQRLKYEVMQLPPRFRHRIKSVKDEPRQPLTHSMHLANSARRIPSASQPSLDRSSSTPISASHPPTPSAGLSKDMEVRRRYNAPLISEIRDIPSPSVLSERVLPICYEEGLSGGLGSAPVVGELLHTALEFFVKESMASILGPTRINAPLSDPAANGGSTASALLPSAVGETLPDGAFASAIGVHTASFKKRVAREEEQARRGTIKRNEAGLLPVEVQVQRAQGQGRGLQGDVRMAWELDNPWLKALLPWAGERLYANDEMEYMDSDEDAEEDWMADFMNGLGRVQTRVNDARASLSVNGHSNGAVDGAAVPDDAMDVDVPLPPPPRRPSKRASVDTKMGNT